MQGVHQAEKTKQRAVLKGRGVELSAVTVTENPDIPIDKGDLGIMLYQILRGHEDRAGFTKQLRLHPTSQEGGS